MFGHKHVIYYHKELRPNVMVQNKKDLGPK